MRAFDALPMLAASMLMVAGCDTAPPPSQAVLGKHQFDNYCMPCHTETGHGNPDIAAPSIAGLPEWYINRQLVKYRKGLRGDHFDDIEGYRMRPMSLVLRSEDAVRQVSAYVTALKKLPLVSVTLEGGNAEKGKTLYALCAACHGADGVGNEALGSPPLTHTQDWYLLTQLKKFKSGARAYDKADTWGATMVPMAQGLADEQAMKDVVAYIQTLRK